MKFKIIKQNDSVYSDHWISLDITKDNWLYWCSEVRKREIEASKTWIYQNVGIFDTDECWECWIVSEEHAREIIKFVLKNNI